MEHERFPRSMELFRRAARVIPQGIYGHLTPAFAGPLVSPYFVSRAEGCRFWDVDGNEFIDFMCAYGPMVLGYNNPEVEEAARAQAQQVSCASHPAEVMVELAETLVAQIPMADWVVFGKNGADMTNYSLVIARAHTRKRKIITVQGAYHGTAPWTGASHAGILPEDRQHILTMPWGDLGIFHRLVERHRGDIAGAIFTPFHHPTWAAQQLPPVGFWHDVRQTCTEEGIVLILDDIRAGFRLHLGGTHEALGFAPDLCCFGKAMANGHPISALAGTEALRISTVGTFHTGTFWFGAEPMAASLATLRILQRDRAIERMRQMGERLGSGLKEMARAHDLQVTISGPPAMPFLQFANESDFMRSQLFCAEVMRRGIFFHPHHNWFISAAHTEQEIDRSVSVADEAFRVVRQTFGG